MVRKLVLTCLVVLLSGCGVHTVDTGFVGIKHSFGQVEGPPLQSGLYFVNPFTTSIDQMDTKVQVWSEKTLAYTKDVQPATVNFTINYRLQPSAAATMYQTVGLDWDDKLVKQVVFQRLKDVIGGWNAIDLINNREKANNACQAAIAADLATKDIVVTNFSITGVLYTAQFDAAVEAKVIAQQQAEQAQNTTERIKQEAAQTVITAQAAAQSMKIRADALSQNPRLVGWEAVQKWDGHLPTNMYGGAALPFVDVTQSK